MVGAPSTITSESVCEGLLEVNLHTSVSYCVLIRSCVVILHCVGISSCVGSAPGKCILKNRKTNAWSKNASKNSKREGWASSVKTFVMGRGVMYAGQVVKIEYLKVRFEFSKVRFELLKGQRSVQHAEDIRVNECTPRECTLACKAQTDDSGFAGVGVFLIFLILKPVPHGCSTESQRFCPAREVQAWPGAGPGRQV